MAKKSDNYSWLDNYSTDPRDTAFRDITERHQDRQQHNRDRDAHDRENDGLNLAGSGTSTTGLYDDLVFDGSRGHAPTAPPKPPTPSPTSAVPTKRRGTPAPPPPGATPPPPPAAPRAQRRPDRLPSIQPAPLKAEPSVPRPAQPRQIPSDGAGIFATLRRVGPSLLVPVIIGGLLLASSLSDSADTPTAAPQGAPVPVGTPVADLLPGECFLAPPGPGIAIVQVRSCNQPHGGEVIAVASGSVSEALEQCQVATDNLNVEVIARLPDDATFTLLLNDPNHRCVVLSQSTELIGSVLQPS